MRTKKRTIQKLTLLFSFLTFSLFAATITVSAEGGRIPSGIQPYKQKVKVNAGKEFELKVRTTPQNADDDYLSWKITSGKKYVRFEDSDLHDDEVDLVALKSGSAKVQCSISGTSKKITFTVQVKNASKSKKKIKASGSQNRTVAKGDDFELKIKKYSGLKDRYLKWSIKNKKIVNFDDYETTGDDVEFRALKTGTTTITCTNQKTNQKISFTIKVVNNQNWDDDDDDDDDDDWDDDDD